MPKLRAATSQSAGVPGTPTDSPELTTVLKSIAVPSGLVNVVGVNVLRRGLAAVDRADLVRAGVVVDEEPAAADAGAEGLGHAEGGRGGDGRVGGVAALGQDVDADLAGVTVDRG